MCASLDTLSSELLDLIITHLNEVPPTYSYLPNVHLPSPTQNLARFATVSRTWQHAIERHTFAAISTFSGDLPTLKRVFKQSPWRKQHLRALFYSIDLPLYSEDRRFCYERRREHQANLVAFRKGVAELWAELASWDTGLPARIRLVLVADAPINRGWEGEDPPPPGIAHQRWSFPEHSLTLHNHTDEAPILPVLRNVMTLQVATSGRRIYPTAINQLVSSLSNLRKLEMNLFPVQPKNRDLRADLRDELARVLENPMLQNLEVLRIEMGEVTPYNHNYRIAVQEDPAYPDGDHLCRAVCRLAQRNLRELYMVGPCLISPALWGLSHNNMNPAKLEITFPQLEVVKIEFALITYDGRWYYTGDPTEDQMVRETFSQLASDSDSGTDSCSSFNSEYHDEINEYRQECLNGNYPYSTWRHDPDPKTFGPLQRGMVLAARQMPKLRSLEMRTRDPGEYDTEVSFQCLAPGVPVDDVGSAAQPEEQLREWRWAVCCLWDPRWEISEDIRQLMMDHLGGRGRILFFP
ncbi:hypothetical protein BJX63DRAFT_137249 [Aspergillus granulosus]|uniref:F-box domain-containing protein n=1 Tax=Aspergillus granulosus TaxID=176169 RepID=A0ABR4HLX6_9EURO